MHNLVSKSCNFVTFGQNMKKIIDCELKLYITSIVLVSREEKRVKPSVLVATNFCISNADTTTVNL